MILTLDPAELMMAKKKIKVAAEPTKKKQNLIVCHHCLYNILT